MSGLDYTVERVRTVDCGFEPAAWAFAVDNAADIDAFWRRAVAEKPKLFNGRVLLQQSGGVSGESGARILRASYFETDFKAFMAWRAFGVPDGRIRNGFALAALRGACGGFVVGEMASHTANAGRVYFPGGTPDPQDIKDGKVDLLGSVLRELTEETGLGADEVVADADWTVLVNARHVACMKILRSPETAQNLAARINRTLAAETGAELARVHVIRELADCADLPLVDFMVPFLQTMF